MNIIKSQNNKQNDKPSLHWSKGYMNRVWKITNKNSKFNFDAKNTTFDRVYNYYLISWMDFLPCFIGWCHSLFTLSYSYGIIKSSTVFHNPLYKHFLRRYLVCILIHYIFCPFFIFLILFLGPAMAIGIDKLFATWVEFFSKGDLSQSMILLSENIVKPIFNTNTWWICLLILAFGSCFNVATILSFLSINRRDDMYMRLIFLEDELKMKLTGFRKR